MMCLKSPPRLIVFQVVVGIAGAVSRTIIAPLETIMTHLMDMSSGHSSIEVLMDSGDGGVDRSEKLEGDPRWSS